MNQHLRTVILSAAALLTFAPVVAQEVEATSAPVTVAKKPPVTKLGTGFDYSRGKYGFTQATEVISVPVNASYEVDRWAFRASLPYITIIGPATVVAGQSPVAAPGRPTTRRQSGVGDPTIGATYHARPVPGTWNIDLSSRVKLPVASEDKGLGTGEVDYYAQFDTYKSFGRFTPFASIGYRFLGSNPDFPLKDGAYVSVGGSIRLVGTTIIGAAYDWRTKIIEGAEDATDGIAFLSTDLSPRWNLLAYVLVGFNEASPDVGVGSAATFKF